VKYIKIIDYFIYLHKILTNQPYLGIVLRSLQCLNTKRITVMESMIEKELKDAETPYRILEIGSWAGQSTMVWGLACKKRGRGKVFCVDTWKGADNVIWMQNMKHKILKLFYHNIKASGLEDHIVPINGSSDEIANILRKDSFNFIYIDGNHSYKQFKKDLVNYMKSVKVGGILCGDDLNLFPKEIDMAYTREHCEEDFIDEPNTGKAYHPGIALGIYEVFGNNIVMKEGFWAMRKMKGNWETVEL